MTTIHNVTVKKLLIAPLICLCIFYVSNVHAYKYQTHFYVGQQIINDIMEDINAGLPPKLSVKVGDVIHKLDPDPRLVEAIKQYPDVFRMACLGPDEFPDVIGGQFTIHPGVFAKEEIDALVDRTAPKKKDKDGNETNDPDVRWGFKSDDWMEYIYNNSNLDDPLQAAFFFGFMVHAASDVWAHSYVNMYSGDHFWITDGEVEVEKRHVALERYIDYRMPDAVDLQGVKYDHSNGYIFPDDVLDRLSDYVAKLLIYEDRKLDYQYENGFGPHLAFFNNHFHTIVDFKNGKIPGFVKKLQDAFGDFSTVLSYLNQLNLEKAQFIDLSNALSTSSLSNVEVNVDNYVNFSQAKWNIGVNEVPALGNMVSMKNSFVTYKANFGYFTQLRNSLEKVSLVYVGTCSKKVKDPVTGSSVTVHYPCDINAGLSSLLNTSLINTFSYDCGSNWNSVFSEFGVSALTIVGCSINGDWSNANNGMIDSQNGMDFNLSGIVGMTDSGSGTSVTPQVLGNVDSMFQDYCVKFGVRYDAEWEKSYVMEGHLPNPTTLNPLKSILEVWIADYKVAMKNWIKASIESTKRQHEPPEDGVDTVSYILEPFLDWEKCWIRTVVYGSPAVADEFKCQVDNDINGAQQYYEQEAKDLAMFFLPKKVKEINAEIEEFLALVQARIGEGAISLISTVLHNQDIYGYIQILGADFTPNKLTKIFSADINDCTNPMNEGVCKRGLIIIPDILDRVNAEMGITADTGTGYDNRTRMNPDNYNNFFNAIQMAKLSMIQTSEINRWVTVNIGISTSLYGSGLYDPSDNRTPPFILMNSIGSLDGSNQWQPISLPFGRNDYEKAIRDLPQYYGRHYNEVNPFNTEVIHGFRLFQDTNAREKIFLKVFKGPVAPGIESPDELGSGFTEILGGRNETSEGKHFVNGYWGYRACKKNPFPVRYRSNIPLNRATETGYLPLGDSERKALVLIQHRLIPVMEGFYAGLSFLNPPDGPEFYEEDILHHYKDNANKIIMTWTHGDYYLEEDPTTGDPSKGCGNLPLPVDYTGVPVDAWYDDIYMVANATYDITHPIEIPGGVTLRVREGTTVNFHPNTGIENYGTLVVEGEANNNAVLTSFQKNPSPGSWNGIRLHSGSHDNVFNYAHISWADTGIYTDNSDLVVTDSFIKDNNTGILITGATTLATPKTFSSLSSSTVGDTLTEPKQSITNSDITNNSNGIKLSANAMPIINWNRIFGNTLYNVYADGYNDAASVYVDLESNWWGTESGLDIMASIHDNIDSPVTAPFVDFVPFQNQTGALTNGDILLGQIDSQYLSEGITTYNAIGAVTVAEGDSLIVPEGYTFVFHGQNSELLVEGSLSTNGTIEYPVQMTSPSATSGGWKGIHLTPASHNTYINGANIQNAIYGVWFDNVGGELVNSMLRNNLSGVLIEGNASPTVKDNVISQNDVGVKLRGTIENSPNPVITANQIASNVTWALDSSYNPNTILDVSGNWWGTTDVLALIDIMYDNIDDPFGSPEARFTPFLDAPGGNLVYGNALAGDWQGKPAISEGKTYHVVGTTTIPADRNMIVPRDTEFLFHNLAKPFVVNGTMDVQGMPGKPAIFTSPYVPESTTRGKKPDLVIAPKRADAHGVMAIPINNGTSDIRGAWYGIKVEDGGYANVESAIIEYANYGLYFDAADGYVSNTLLKNNTFGLWVEGGSPIVEYSRLYNNEVGVYVRGAQKEGYFSNPVVTHSALSSATYDYYVGPRGYGMAEELDATNNWWWTKDLSVIADWIYDSNDDPENSHAVVNFNPIVKGGPNLQ